jgi:two-component system cell cycle sensor histidine kinase/response regulator CckA
MKTNSVGKILVVDDEVELKNILVEAVTSQGYEACGFNNGTEALAALRSEAFDVLLTDLMMPAMDGITLVKESMQIDPHLVCMVMTGQGTIQTAVDAMKEGAFDYVLKPFRLQTVLPVLTRAMNTRRMRLENLQLRETVAIYELAQAIAFTLDPQTVISKLADAALQQTDADEVSVLLPVGEGSDELYVAAVRGVNRERLLGERVPMEESISGWVAREREPLILDGEVNDKRFRSSWPHPEIRSAISVPMQVANKLVGTININALSRPRPFTLGQMKALTILASTAAAALESASLYGQVRRAEENYRSIFENAVEGIFQATPEGRFLTVNPAMARILGYESPAEMIETITDVTNQLYVNPESRTEAARLQEECGIVQGFEFEAYRKDGEKIWLSLNRRAIRDENGIEVYREGSIEDITERKRAEDERAQLAAEIESQRERLRSIFDTVPGVVWEAWGQPDVSTQRIDFVSDYVETLLGYSVEEWLSTPNFWLTIVHPDDKEHAAREAATNFAAGKNSTVEFRWVAKDGHAVWIESNYAVIKDDEGHPVGLRGVTTDVSERKRAEEALRESEGRFRTIFEQAGAGVAEIDSHSGRFLQINQRYGDIAGYSREEMLAQTFIEITPPEDRPPDLAKMELMLTGKIREFTLEKRYRRKDGTLVWVSRTVSPLWPAGAEPTTHIAVVQDITERKQLEDQLRQSQKMEAIGQLAGGVAHDFNNLLTAINGYSSLALQRIEDNNPIKSYLEEIRKAGDRAANLTRQLLAFGRKQILKPLPLSLNDVVTDMNKMLRRLIGENIQLSAKLTPDLKRVKADPGQIEQVLVNLVVNARDAMPQGGSLTIETANAELGREYASTHVGVNAGAFVVLAVSDTGSGMDEETQKRIFEPFFTTKEKGKGTGLGLSTVYGIVKQSEGNISAYSEPNHGTTFKVYLPALDSVPKSSGAKTAESVILRGSETIMLVEDEEVVRGLARQILEQAGYQVLVAQQGEEAIRLCNEHAQEIHLLLTDVVMPGAGGKEVADRLSSLRPGIKVLFMSGYTDEAIVHHGVLDSDVKFIQKPFSPTALAKKVREVLDSNGKVSTE